MAGRPKNLVSSKQVTVSLTAIMHGELEQIVSSGHFGKGVSDAVDRLLTEAIRVHYKEGVLVRKSDPKEVRARRAAVDRRKAVT